MKKIITIMLIGALCVSTITLTGCQSDAQTGALTGAAVGAGAGQLFGGDTGSTLLGAGIGAGAGYIIGNERDKGY